MIFWKLGVCLTILAAASSSGKSLEDVQILNFIPKVAELFPSAGKRAPGKIVNKEIDSALKKLNDYITSKGLNSTALPDEGFEWEFKFGPNTYAAEMTLKNGRLQGLANIERWGDADLSSDGETILLTLPLTFPSLVFTYDYTAKLLGIGPKGGVEGRIEGAKFIIVVEIDPVTLQAKLKSYKLTDGGKITIKFTGNDLADWIVNMFVNVTLRFLKPVIKNFISGWVLNGVSILLGSYNEYICSLQGLC